MHAQHHETQDRGALTPDDTDLRAALASVPHEGVRLGKLPADTKLEPYLSWCGSNLDAWTDDAMERGKKR
ncbi:MAG TPA: hypothetical protein VF292_07420 [Rhodanobacteraceae bacterium]